MSLCELLNTERKGEGTLKLEEINLDAFADSIKGNFTEGRYAWYSNNMKIFAKLNMTCGLKYNPSLTIYEKDKGIIIELAGFKESQNSLVKMLFTLNYVNERWIINGSNNELTVLNEAGQKCFKQIVSSFYYYINKMSKKN